MEPIVKRAIKRKSTEIPENVKQNFIELNLIDGDLVDNQSNGCSLNVTVDKIEYYRANNDKQWSSRFSDVSTSSSASNNRLKSNQNVDPMVDRINKRIRTLDSMHIDYDKALIAHESRILELEKSDEIRKKQVEALDAESSVQDEKIGEHFQLLSDFCEKFIEHDDKFKVLNQSMHEMQNKIQNLGKKGFQCELCKRFYASKSYLPYHKCSAVIHN